MKSPNRWSGTGPKENVYEKYLTYNIAERMNIVNGNFI
jgi:hypothetical protein